MMDYIKNALGKVIQQIPELPDGTNLDSFKFLGEEYDRIITVEHVLATYDGKNIGFSFYGNKLVGYDNLRKILKQLPENTLVEFAHFRRDDIVISMFFREKTLIGYFYYGTMDYIKNALENVIQQIQELPGGTNLDSFKFLGEEHPRVITAQQVLEIYEGRSEHVKSLGRELVGFDDLSKILKQLPQDTPIEFAHFDQKDVLLSLFFREKTLIGYFYWLTVWGEQ